MKIRWAIAAVGACMYLFAIGPVEQVRWAAPPARHG